MDTEWVYQSSQKLHGSYNSKTNENINRLKKIVRKKFILEAGK